MKHYKRKNKNPKYLKVYLIKQLPMSTYGIMESPKEVITHLVKVPIKTLLFLLKANQHLLKKNSYRLVGENQDIKIKYQYNFIHRICGPINDDYSEFLLLDKESVIFFNNLGDDAYPFDSMEANIEKETLEQSSSYEEVIVTKEDILRIL